MLFALTSYKHKSYNGSLIQIVHAEFSFCFCQRCLSVLSRSLSLPTHANTHTRIYIHIHIHVLTSSLFQAPTDL